MSKPPISHVHQTGYKPLYLPMLLSVVILNYNVAHFLELCVSSVQRAIRGLDAEIIVVDNASSDSSCDRIRSRFPDVQLLVNSANEGFPKGNNIGVARAKGEFLCILNPDTIVSETIFHQLLDYHVRVENPGIIGCKLIDGAGNFLPESKRGIPTPWVAFTKIAGLFKIAPNYFGKYYASHLSKDQNGKMEIAVGAFMFLKREHYLEIGGFDEACFMYSDDIDLSYMMLQTGRQNYYFGQGVCVHFKGESTLKDALYMNRFREAMDFFYTKHFKKSVVFDLMLRAGSYWFANRKKNSTKKISKPQQYIVVSTNPSIGDQLDGIRMEDCQWVTKLDEAEKYVLGEKSVRLIFDTIDLKFSDILDFMQRSASENVTYRFLMKDFLIGSDSSLDRGEVIELQPSKTIATHEKMNF